MDINRVTKQYTNGEVTVVWKPALCIHAKKCWTGLPTVFNPREKPWVKIGGADTTAIMTQVESCPSGALSYFRNDAQGQVEAAPIAAKVEVMKNGPLLVHGAIVLKDKHGNESNKDKVTAFCRCGQSGNKPFCDGTHNTYGFKDE